MSGPMPLDRTGSAPLVPLEGKAQPMPLGQAGPKPLAGQVPQSAHQRLRHLSHQLEGVFLDQLFQAMRATVPQSEENSSTSQQIFNSMLDERLSSVAADHLQRGMGEALYRELARRLPQEEQP